MPIWMDSVKEVNLKMYKRTEISDVSENYNPGMKKKWVRYKEGALMYS